MVIFQFEENSVAKKKFSLTLGVIVLFNAIVTLFSHGTNNFFENLMLTFFLSVLASLLKNFHEVSAIKIEDKYILLNYSNQWGLTFEEKISFDNLEYNLVVTDHRRIVSIEFYNKKNYIAALNRKTVKRIILEVNRLSEKLEEIKNPRKEKYSVW